MAMNGSTIRKRYIVTAFVLILSAIAYVLVARPMLRSMGATTYGPLSSHSKDIILVHAEKLLMNVPPLSDLSDDSLRFVAMPSFGDRWMAVSLSSDGSRASGNLAVLDRKTGKVSKRAFRLTEPEFDRFTTAWDAETGNYWGALSLCADGTSLGFERRRGSTITSGIGNSPCHYDVLGDLAADHIGPHAEELTDLSVPYIDRFLASDHC